jgi:hypothetical protein
VQIKKVLTANDVGLTGSHQAGMLVPKSDPELLRFFPRLNHRVLNPRADVNLSIPELGQQRTLQFIYYNNKRVAGGTRDEFRLTGMTSIFRALGAQPEDCVILTRDQGDQIALTLDRRTAPDGTNRVQLRIKGWTVTRRETVV